MEVHNRMEIQGGESWKKEKLIGYGGQALVFLATTKQTQTDYSSQRYLPPLMAIKSVDTVNCIPLMKEREIFSKLEGCKHIIKCYGDKLTLENDHMIYNILLEFAEEGSLSNKIQSYGHGYGFTENEVRDYTESILLGLKHIHDRGYVHRDIKPQNILICKNNTAKIADFGYSKKVNPHKKKMIKKEFSLKGTPLYMAPESVTSGDYGPSCDVWALGCVVLEMLTGKQAWNLPPKTPQKTLLRLIACSSQSPFIPGWVSEEAKDFMKKCFIKDPESRWTIDMLLKHPFIVHSTTEIDDLPRPNLPGLNCQAQHRRKRNITDVINHLQHYFSRRKFEEANQSIEGNPIVGEKRKRAAVDDKLEVTDSNSMNARDLIGYWCIRKFAKVASDQSADINPLGF